MTKGTGSRLFADLPLVTMRVSRDLLSSMNSRPTWAAAVSHGRDQLSRKAQ